MCQVREIHTLATSLKKEPSYDLRPLFGSLSQKTSCVIGVVTIHEVKQNGIALPYREIVVRMVN